MTRAVSPVDNKVEAKMDARDTPPNPAQNAEHKTRGRPFEPGKSGNPTGRPKGARNKATLAIEELLNGEAAALTRKAIDKALEGDMAALRLCLDRLLPPQRDRLVNFELPTIESASDALKASSAILASCAAGLLSLREAVEFQSLISNHVRMHESNDFAARLAALEAEGTQS
jgi:Family of unknown function (DUF5681)